MESHPTYPSLRRDIAGASVAGLAAEFGTPLFVYDAERIRERIADLGAFDVVRYAQKAWPNIAALDLMRRAGVLVDATSAGEVYRAMRAGYSAAGDPAPIVYTADIFDRDSLELVVAEGVHVNCGSIDMIEQYGTLSPGRSITLRINPGFGHGHSRKTNTGGDQSKHGIWHERLDDAVAAAHRLDLTVSGIHVHIGSGADMEHLAQVCGAVEGLARRVGPEITTISGGGGLPIPYRESDSFVDVDAYFELWDATRRRLAEDFGHPVRLEIEPGRYLVAESGYLVAEIRAVKRQGDNLFYVVDAGFNNLARPVLYGAYHPMAVAPARDAGGEPSLENVVVGGPLCESGDIFTQEEGGFVRTEALPRAEVGDYVVIACAGAYGSTMGSNYNSKPMAAEVLLDAGRAELIRRRQTLEGMLADERIPGS
jgi:diaminopimelate decarboxylase